MSMSIGIILTPDERSKAYIQKILKNNIQLDYIILMNDHRVENKFSSEQIQESLNNGFDISISVIDTLKDRNIDYKEFPFVDINHPKLIEYLETISTEYMIFTGGGILQHEVLSLGIKFIHLHPGIVPEYRGSTCFYYSILNEDKAGVTAFIMDEHLDTGDTIIQKSFQKPHYKYIDEVYDPYIRSETLIELLTKKNLMPTNFVEQNPLEGETYYIIHPILKHIAILSCISND